MKQSIELVGSVEVAEDIEKKVRTVGLRGIDLDKAHELGVFERISKLLCASHASIMAGYRIYGGVEYMMYEINIDQNGKKRSIVRNDIKKEMEMFNRAVDHFVRFWSGYYSKEYAAKEINEETENLYHHIMSLMQLPETWQLGDSQHTDSNDGVAIVVKRKDERDLYFHNSVLDAELLEDVTESWFVTKYDERTKAHTTCETDMDKASAMMVAKRLSSDDTSAIYTASIVREFVERRTEVTPYKCYKNNETIGKLKKLVK